MPDVQHLIPYFLRLWSYLHGLWSALSGPGALAGLALLISALSYRTATRSYRLARQNYDRSGPRITTWLEVVEFVNTNDSTIYLYVVVRNAGLAAIDVERLNLAAVNQGSWWHMIILSEVQPSHGPQLPVRVEPLSSLLWEFAFSPEDWRRIEPAQSRGWRKLFDRYKLDADLGDGSSVTYHAEASVLRFLTSREDMRRNARFRAVYRRRSSWPEILHKLI